MDSRSPTTDLQIIPTDVLQHHIFNFFDLSCLLVCSFVCSRLRKLTSAQLSVLPHDKRHQNRRLQELFRNGNLNLLSWFQRRLGYPSMAALSALRPALLDKCVLMAAKGFYIKFRMGRFFAEYIRVFMQAGRSIFSCWRKTPAARLTIMLPTPPQSTGTCMYCIGFEHTASKLTNQHV